MKRRNKEKWLKENPEWEHLGNQPIEWDTIQERLFQWWLPEEEHPRMGYVVKNPKTARDEWFSIWKMEEESVLVKLFDGGPSKVFADMDDEWFFIMKAKEGA